MSERKILKDGYEDKVRVKWIFKEWVHPNSVISVYIDSFVLYIYPSLGFYLHNNAIKVNSVCGAHSI